MGNRGRGFPLRPRAVPAISPSRLGTTTLVRSSRFRRRFHAVVSPRFARPPATQTPPSFWEGKIACASLGQSATHRLLQHTSTREHTVRTVRPRPRMGFDTPSRCRVVRSRGRVSKSAFPKHRQRAAQFPCRALTPQTTFRRRGPAWAEKLERRARKRAPLLVISRAPGSPILRRARAGDSLP
jgi:hypothetical protein